jgi:hypothetical protein
LLAVLHPMTRPQWPSGNGIRTGWKAETSHRTQGPLINTSTSRRNTDGPCSNNFVAIAVSRFVSLSAPFKFKHVLRPANCGIFYFIRDTQLNFAGCRWKRQANSVHLSRLLLSEGLAWPVAGQSSAWASPSGTQVRDRDGIHAPQAFK